MSYVEIALQQCLSSHTEHEHISFGPRYFWDSRSSGFKAIQGNPKPFHILGSINWLLSATSASHDLDEIALCCLL